MARKLTKRQPRKDKQAGFDSGYVALYIRVSTAKQKDEGYSLDAQRERLVAFCVSQEWQVSEDHIYTDAGISGKGTEKRDAFNAMMQAAETGIVRRIVTMKLDRLARNVRDFLLLVDRLQAWGCDLVIVKESFDTSTPHGKFALTMFAAMAELEAATITERVMSGKRQKASKGGYNGSRAPLGYDFKKAAGFSSNEDAPTVRKIFKAFNTGFSLTDIARLLNSDGIPTSRGGRWHAATVRYILLNGFYAGLSQWSDEDEQPGEHEAIITIDEYRTAQRRLDAMKPGPMIAGGIPEESPQPEN